MDLINLCSSIASRGYLWVQGAGGNVSEKRGGELWIKPSGFRLDEIQTQKDLACVDLEKIRKGLQLVGENESEYSALLVRSQILQSHRPSMETGFHAVLAERLVAHFHSLISVLIVQEYNENPAAVRSWYKSYWQNYLGSLRVLPLKMPGLQLSLQLQGSIQDQVILLENHGVILQHSSNIELDQFFEMEKDFCLQFNYPEAIEIIEGRVELPEAAPIRFLFPDFAIVFDKLFPWLEQTPQGFRPKPGISESLGEIWQAHCFLSEVGRSLRELPKSFIDQLVHLPTEKFRMMKDLK